MNQSQALSPAFSLHSLARATGSLVPRHLPTLRCCSQLPEPWAPDPFGPRPVLPSLPGTCFLLVPGQRAPTYPPKPRTMGSSLGRMSQQMHPLPPLSVYTDSLLNLLPTLISLH